MPADSISAGIPVSALALCFVQLNGEVVRGSIGEGLVGNDLEALGLCLFYELVVNAGGVNVIVLPDDRNLGAELLLCDVLCGCGAWFGP